MSSSNEHAFQFFCNIPNNTFHSCVSLDVKYHGKYNGFLPFLIPLQEPQRDGWRQEGDFWKGVYKRSVRPLRGTGGAGGFPVDLRQVQKVPLTSPYGAVTLSKIMHFHVLQTIT